MCGITGIVDMREQRPINMEVLKSMNASLEHRGPDGDGFHVEPGVGFGHRRLSIIDLEGGKQPLYNEDGSVVVTYNGEIYNFKELESQLQKRGHIFRTRCDTEVIVHAWEEWGEQCLEHFNGMFSFAVWDRNKQSLFMARDRLGIKPLYYSELGDGRVVFGSELKALLKCPEIDRTLDPQAVEDYLTFGYVPDPRSIFAGVKKLEAGCYISARRGKRLPSPVRYWDVPLFDGNVRSVSELSGEALAKHLQIAVQQRLLADVPLGAFLSGGIDSSAVVAMMRESNIENLLTCSIGFKEKRYDESKFANQVAIQKQTNHHLEFIEANDYDLLEKLVNVYDEPYADSSALPTYRVCQLARKHVKVVLSGDGGDENFIGYRRYRLFALEERLRAPLPIGFRKALFGPLGRYYPKFDRAPRIFRGKTTFQALARSSSEAYKHAISLASDEMREALYSDSFKADLQGYHSDEVFRRYLSNKEFSDSLRMVQYLDFKTYLPGDILTKVDRASMANSLEVRVPFLNHHFVEWVASLPTKVKLRKSEGKYLLKKSLEPYLSKEILYRRKMGFAVPLDIWFRKSLKEKISMSVSQGVLKDSGMFNHAYLDQLVREHQSGYRDHSAPLWSLLMLEGFLKSI